MADRRKDIEYLAVVCRGISDPIGFKDHAMRIPSAAFLRGCDRRLFYGSRATPGLGTVDKISASARLATSVLAAEESNAYSLASLPLRHVWSNGVDMTDHLVSWNTRKREAAKLPFNGCAVRMTNAPRLHAEAYLSRARLDKRTNDLCELTGGDDF